MRIPVHPVIPTTPTPTPPPTTMMMATTPTPTPTPTTSAGIIVCHYQRKYVPVSVLKSSSPDALKAALTLELKRVVGNNKKKGEEGGGDDDNKDVRRHYTTGVLPYGVVHAMDVALDELRCDTHNDFRGRWGYLLVVEGDGNEGDGNEEPEQKPVVPKGLPDRIRDLVHVTVPRHFDVRPFVADPAHTPVLDLHFHPSPSPSPSPSQLPSPSRLLVDLQEDGDGRTGNRQRSAVEFTHRALLRTGGAVVCMPMGKGKTVCTLALVDRLGARRSLVLVNSWVLANQWKDRIKSALGVDAVIYDGSDVCAHLHNGNGGRLTAMDMAMAPSASWGAMRNSFGYNNNNSRGGGGNNSSGYNNNGGRRAKTIIQKRKPGHTRKPWDRPARRADDPLLPSRPAVTGPGLGRLKGKSLLEGAAAGPPKKRRRKTVVPKNEQQQRDGDDDDDDDEQAAEEGEEVVEEVPVATRGVHEEEEEAPSPPPPPEIVVALVQTLNNNNAFLPHAFDLVVYDECHHMHDSFIANFTKTNAGMTLGLSATPCRKDGQGKAIFWWLGKMGFNYYDEHPVLPLPPSPPASALPLPPPPPVAVPAAVAAATATPPTTTRIVHATLCLDQGLQDWWYLHNNRPPTRDHRAGSGGGNSNSNNPNNPKTCYNSSSVETKMSLSPRRNDAIACFVARHLAGRNVLVVTKRTKQATVLANLITRELGRAGGGHGGGYGSSEEEVGVLVGGAGKSKKAQARRERVLETARVIVGTSQYVGEGLDVPRLDTLVLAAPMVDIYQPVGRIMRMTTTAATRGGAAAAAAPRYRLIVDVMDALPPQAPKDWGMLRAWYQCRRKVFYDAREGLPPKRAWPSEFKRPYAVDRWQRYALGSGGVARLVAGGAEEE